MRIWGDENVDERKRECEWRREEEKKRSGLLGQPYKLGPGTPHRVIDECE